MDKETVSLALKGPTLVIDGKCNLCNSASGFIARRQAKQEFQFLWAQHPETQEILRTKFDVTEESIMQSWALLLDGKIYRGSTAWLHATEFLVEPWKTIGKLGWCIPEAVREMIYSWIANNRYRLFGASDSCVIPREGKFLHK
jgi:predicted DCC family thiol-disulfide oxidoreductase YuxK